MNLPRALMLAGILTPAATAAQPVAAEQLYQDGSWSALATDRKAAAVGDSVVVVIYQSTRASSRLENNSSRNSEVGGGLKAGGIDESASLDFGGSYAGKGEAVRTEQFVAQMSALVTQIMPNGDLVIEGTQQMLINGEETAIGVRGRIRPQDISAENAVLSSRLADAQIDYDGKGFVSRSAKPGLLNRIFSFLGIG
jgi:flagellar L-ring protein precursor FlgH